MTRIEFFVHVIPLIDGLNELRPDVFRLWLLWVNSGPFAQV